LNDAVRSLGRAFFDRVPFGPTTRGMTGRKAALVGTTMRLFETLTVIALLAGALGPRRGCRATYDEQRPDRCLYFESRAQRIHHGGIGPK
jgi:hypothetical protein